MYDFLRGQVREVVPGRVVLDVNGVGYILFTTNGAAENIEKIGKETFFWTHLHYREDGPSIYAFLERQERELFRLLIRVNGIGPKLAMQILSGIRPQELVQALANEDWKRLTLISGIGPKTARRLLIALKEKLTDQELQFAPSGSAPKDPILSQAFSALLNLGLPPETVRMALRDIPASDNLEEIVKKALTKLAP